VLAFNPTPVPLENWPDGTVRVAGTRVLLELVVEAFRNGATPEQIAKRYTTVSVAAGYAIIAWVLEHKHEVDAYMSERAALSTKVRDEHERLNPPGDFWSRLRARKNNTGT
jgi:uncharacterized protein (DUF433 family)